MNVLFTASECAPVVKVGGLGDVVGTLPIALKKLGVKPFIAIPAYKPTLEQYPELFKNLVKNIEIEFAGKKNLVNVYKSKLPGSDIELFLLKNERYISDFGVYYDPGGFPSTQTELERFAFFSKAVVEAFFKCDVAETTFDIIHCNDWQTGLIPNLIKVEIENKELKIIKRPKIIFTIHNLAYQGFSSVDIVQKLEANLDKSKIVKWDMQDDNVDFVMQGILGADYVTTVSPNYAREIQTPQFGEGLDEIIKARESRIFGILNGVDYSVWDPATDTKIYKNYSLSNLGGKTENKLALQKELGLIEDSEKPIISFISRLVNQKGVDLVISSLKDMAEQSAQIVILGAGDEVLESRLRINQASLISEGLTDISINIKYDNTLANKIFAGSDIFLMPSRFEPCGLTQIIAMKYGTLPIVRKTGGLVDTVESGVTGFMFDSFNKNEFMGAIKRALDYYKNKTAWQKLMVNAMSRDFSWNESAKKYMELYKMALNN